RSSAKIPEPQNRAHRSSTQSRRSVITLRSPKNLKAPPRSSDHPRKISVDVLPRDPDPRSMDVSLRGEGLAETGRPFVFYARLFRPDRRPRARRQRDLQGGRDADLL